MSENAVVGFDYEARTVSPIFARWMIFADEELPEIEGVDLCQIPEAGRFKFLIQDDSERDVVQAALVAARISFDRPVDVELTNEHKQYIRDSGITQRADVDAAISRAERIAAMTTIDELKAELITRPTMSSRDSG